MTHLPSYLTISGRPQETLGELISIRGPDLVGFLVDENTKRHCLPFFETHDALIITIRSGEAHKTLESCQLIWKEMTKAGFSRKSLLVNLGGGVIGDMGGFAASTYKRGIRFINIPTTLLSQVDASIGGKLGIDFDGLKNHIGLFGNPEHVIITPSFLSTLPPRELRSGLAEVIKHALIADKAQWDFLRTTSPDQLDWSELIPHSVSIKNRIVAADPDERGYRKILNFGHTIGHALESYFMATADNLLHGEAVAIGMMVESHLSYQKGWIVSYQKGWIGWEELDHISRYLRHHYPLPAELPAYESIKPLLLQDKKNSSSGICFSLIDKIGHCAFDEKATDTMIKKAMEYVQSLK